MFLDNLSTAVLHLCDEHELTYESAAELCDLSSRYFGDIARRKTSPTIITLEKICTGFQRTPNELLLSEAASRKISLQQQMPVTQVRFVQGPHGSTKFPVCPQCGITLDKEYLTHCGHCGQYLSWTDFPHNTT